MADQQASPNHTDNQPSFVIEKIYLKDQSYEAPQTPAVFKSDWKPQVQLDINTRSTFLEDNFYEVVLGVTVTANNGDQVAYLVEVKYAGIFTLHGFEKPQLQEIMGSFCPGLLYPYVAQSVSDAVLKGGFPQLNLAPVNFEAIYRDQLQRQQNGTEGEVATGAAAGEISGVAN